MAMRYTFFILLLCCLGSCSLKNSDSKASLDKDSTPETSISGEFLTCDSILWTLGIEAMWNNYLIVKGAGEYIYDVFSLSDKSLKKEGSFLKKGNGPFEMLHSDLFKDVARQQLYVSNFNGGIQHVYAISLDRPDRLYDTSSWEPIPFPDYPNHLLFPAMVILNDSTWVLPGSEINADNILSSINMKTGELHKLNFKFPTAHLKTPYQRKIADQMIYSDATLQKHPTQDKIVYSSTSGRYAEILSFTNGEIVHSTSLCRELPLYESKDGVDRHFKDGCLRGMITRVTEQYIFCLFIPLTKKEVRDNISYKGFPNYFSDELIVFDWDGHLISRLRLDMPVCSFVVDEAGNAMYAATLDDAQECVIRKYQLTGVLK